jgi:hypothetical protein
VTPKSCKSFLEVLKDFDDGWRIFPDDRDQEIKGISRASDETIRLFHLPPDA